MFAVGVNLSLDDFKHAVERPGPIALGLAGQYILKPLLGLVFGTMAVRLLHLPEAIGMMNLIKSGKCYLNRALNKVYEITVNAFIHLDQTFQVC